MIVYQCNAKWAMARIHRRWVKMRVSDKSKKQHNRVEAYRRIWFGMKIDGIKGMECKVCFTSVFTQIIDLYIKE
jgi:hypothetical protein